MPQGSVTSLTLLTVFLVGCCTCQIIESIDTIEPIVKISPDRNNTEDRFGISVTAHRLYDVASNDSLQEALNKTVIMIGAPFGRFPGGISGIEIDALACAESRPSDYQNTTQEERMECLKNFTTGLVYQCPLNKADCAAALGNGNATAPDGYLFDRIGNDPAILTAGIPSNSGDENKETQLMGLKVFSKSGFFVACAPNWEHVKGDDDYQPRGRCVYSGKSLTDFTVLRPCERGTANNQNEEGFCSTGIGVDIQEGTDPGLVLGTPSRSTSRGGVFYYQNLTDMSVSSGARPFTVPASIGELVGRRSFVNTPSSLSYYGFSFSEGFISSNTERSFLVGAPRHEITNPLGYVYRIPINNDYQSLPEEVFKGEQFGEMFGYSVLVVDLNNDGYDDAIVGAPMYSERSRPELGRVFVFENNEGNGFYNATIITGPEAGSRFGLALTDLGDLNNDGFKDVAISAPFQESGMVYIYHGQERDSRGSIINTSPKQRIDGATLAMRVSELTNVTTFGFSMSGRVDVDNNQYNDLVVGTYDSQAVFVLRSRPVARTNISLTFSVEAVDLFSFGCSFNGRPLSCFTVTMCASYSGRGVANQFSTNYTLEEVATRHRLYLDDQMNTFVKGTITFYGTNNNSCVERTVYIMNGTTRLDPFTIRANVLNIERPVVMVDTSLDPSDLSVVPVIETTPVSADVQLLLDCGPDDICVSDLVLNIVNITYSGTGGIMTNDQTRLIVDSATRVDVYITFSNRGEDAFNSFLSFALPKDIFTYRSLLPQSSLVTCEETTPSNTTHDNRVCNLRTPLSSEDGTTNLQLRWDVNSLTGKEESVSVPISIMIGPNATRNREDTLGDNSGTTDIVIAAEAMYTVSVSFESTSVIYQGNQSIPSTVRSTSDLGNKVVMTASFRNQGPSSIRNAVLTVYIPARSRETGEYYFYYPARWTTAATNVVCSEDTLNPQGYRIDSARKRRSLFRKRSGLTRVSRQATTSTLNLDCQTSPEECVKVSCNITNLGLTTVDIMITGFLDERFYYRKEDSYVLQAYAEGRVLDSFLNTQGSQSNGSFTVTITSEAMSSTRSGGVPWYVYAAPTAAAFIFLFILIVALYFFGFFKRKKGGSEKAEDDEFVAFDSNPFGGSRSGGVASAPTVDSSSNAELTKYEVKGKEE